MAAMNRIPPAAFTRPDSSEFIFKKQRKADALATPTKAESYLV